ncbi:hypothetical protein ACFFLM_05705 [Deinococcus oregonensis]|uniref:Transposase n=1 Tax=Deinococcus oregonensis TaxID=1805970 RepID=A0ABV6AVE5_9DEIO
MTHDRADADQEGWALFQQRFSVSLPAGLAELTQSGVQERQALAMGLTATLKQFDQRTKRRTATNKLKVNRPNTLKCSKHD